ncbi:hypothetical protein FQZ97_1120610 [compost metagenome]
MLFVPELAAQQFGGVVRNLPQPLLQGLAAFVAQGFGTGCPGLGGIRAQGILGGSSGPRLGGRGALGVAGALLRCGLAGALLPGCILFAALASLLLVVGLSGLVAGLGFALAQ